MVVVCKDNQCTCGPLVVPRDPNAVLSESNYVVSSEWYTIGANLSGYCITKENEYVVYGFLVVKEQIRYLIVDDNGVPGYFPACLFVICDHSTFFDWEVYTYAVGFDTMLAAGCPELCGEYIKVTNMLERQPTAIAIFLEYKEYIEKIY